MVTCTGCPWVERKKADLHERLEGAMHSILALQCAIRTHKQLFSGFEEVSRHTGWLAICLYKRLAILKYKNGRLVCRIYKEKGKQGATIALNVCQEEGTWFSSSEVGKLAKQGKST